MGLHCPHWGWQWSTDNIEAATVLQHSSGTNITTGASSTMGSVVTVLPALARDAEYLMIGFSGQAVSAQDNTAFGDLMVDPAGGTSWSVLIEKLACGFTAGPSAVWGQTTRYYFPIWIKAGSSIGFRAQRTHASTSATMYIAVVAKGQPSRPEMWWCGQGVETLGFSSGSRGALITSGVSGAFGSWTAVGTSTKRYGSLQLGTNGSDASSLAVIYYFEVGVSSAVLPGFPRHQCGVSILEAAQRLQMAPGFHDIPSGTALQVRGAGSVASVEVIDVFLYGVY